ncbi:MAG: transaldolase [bacterium]|nr:transaldolase [bacterium]
MSASVTPGTAGNSVPDKDSPLARAVAAFCLRKYTPPTPAVREALPSSPLWAAVATAGTEPWLDTGDVEAIKQRWCGEFTALTTNNTLLNKEVQKGIYDQLVPDAAKMIREIAPQISEAELISEIAFVLNAVHGLLLVETFDADVSVELHTALAHDSDASYEYGKRFHAIEPKRFIIKIPLTPEGLIAARRLSDDGIRVNFTLGFSARQNYVIAKLARPTWVNVFMGRLNSFVKDSGFGDGLNIGEKATLASNRMLRDIEQCDGYRVRQIGASIRGGQQVHDLLGIDVMTIPTGAADEFMAMAPDLATIVDRSADDPDVDLANSVEAAKCQTFWAIDDSLEDCTAKLAAGDFAAMTGDAVRAHFREHGHADLFADLSKEDLARIRSEGKLPLRASWQDRVVADTASWDGLLTEAALGSFSGDQDALDARIRQYL